MIGVFDSGVGGLTALAELRRLLPRTDMLYLADSENAPYGTKSEEQILYAAEKCIKKLRDAGADKILIACCTASTLHRRLCDASRAVTTPIILPAAKAALRISRGRIAVIATSATVRSRAFSQALQSEGKCEVSEFPAQELVSMVECGASDKDPLTREQKKLLSHITSQIEESRADTLILGCTHFPHIMGHIAAMLPNLTLINPSHEGALELAKSTANRGSGRTVFI